MDIEKFTKYVLKMDPDTFNNFIRVNKILSWKDNYYFTTVVKDEVSEYWWKHKDGSKSGETFETLDEAELSALIHFCKTI